MAHPKGLYLLFFVEMWERFSYYGMRALLVLYMLKYFKFTTEQTGQLYGWYTGLVYLSPLIGGYIADRYLGARKSILIGGLLIAAGHFTMTFQTMPFFFTALGLIIAGTGFFKPNISTIVGQLYPLNDPRRDSGFTIFYMGINLGAFLSPLVCGTLGEKFGWHYGFAAAGFGMLAGLALYLWGQKKYLGNYGLEPLGRSDKNHHLDPLTREEKFRMAAIFILCFFVIFFWSAFEQAGSSLTIFADKSTDRMIPLLNIEIPVSYFQSINPLFIILLAPVFSSAWINMAGRKKEPSTPVKFALGLFLVSFSFIIMMIAGSSYGSGGKVSMFWLASSYIVATLGELCISPVGLSMVSKLSPPRFASLLMGIWFMANFAANYLGGMLAGDYDKMNPQTFFAIPAATAGAAGILLLLLIKPLKRWMKVTPQKESCFDGKNNS